MNEPALVGVADGPPIFVPELGCETNTFTTPPGGSAPALNYHVPLKMRGDFQPEQLANYDPEKSYRTDAFGKMLCYAKAVSTGEKCSRRAVNRYAACIQHGGRLHPLDKIAKEESSNNAEGQALSRYQQFLAKQITVDDLDDEELAVCGFRSPKNGVIFKPRNVPREVVDAFTKAVYERAQAELRSLSVEAAQTVGSIMKNKSIEPDIRMKAALSILERTLGKSPQVVQIGVDTKGFEQVFDGIFNGTREESRQQRGYIDVEFEPERSITAAPDEDSSGGSGSSDGSIVGGNNESRERDDGQSNSEITSTTESIDRSRLSTRNEAILSPTVEIKPFEYDLEDHSKEIKYATKKRYAQADSRPYIIEEKSLGEGFSWIKILEPEKRSVPNKSKAAARKRYTLDDL